LTSDLPIEKIVVWYISSARLPAIVTSPVTIVVTKVLNYVGCLLFNQLSSQIIKFTSIVADRIGVKNLGINLDHKLLASRAIETNDFSTL
jgi:hypothetical protein